MKQHSDLDMRGNHIYNCPDIVFSTRELSLEEYRDLCARGEIDENCYYIVSDDIGNIITSIKLTKEVYTTLVAERKINPNCFYIVIDDEPAVSGNPFNDSIVSSNAGWSSAKIKAELEKLSREFAETYLKKTDISCGTEEMEDGVTPLETGKIYLRY